MISTLALANKDTTSFEENKPQKFNQCVYIRPIVLKPAYHGIT